MLVDNIVKQIAEYYGFANQRRQCVEEMAELTKAICKYDREIDIHKRAELMNDICEELADVEIMVRQLKKLCGEDKVNLEVLKKLKRQLERIAEEEKALT